MVRPCALWKVAHELKRVSLGESGREEDDEEDSV